MIYRFLPDAIYALEPNAHFRINGNFTFQNLTWEPHVDKAIIPTEQAIAQKAKELEADYEAKKYQRDREKIYPEIKEQLDMLWHAIDSGTLDKTSDFYTTLKKVKDDNPKP